MELKTVDPRTLGFDPQNPRRTKATPEQDAQLTANIQQIGLIQPPLVRTEGDSLIVVAGERRVHCSIKAGMTTIPVLVRETTDGADAIRSFAENVVRAQMGPVDQWRAIEALIGDNWTEEAIATAFAYPVRLIRRLRLLAHIHPTILDHIAKGDMPREEELRIIAAATPQEQAAVWKKHKPRRNETAAWWEIANPLRKSRMPKKNASFDDETARRHNIIWEDDLFGPADQDNLYTTQVEAFLAAQNEWIASTLPDNGMLLETDRYGNPDLPPKAERIYGKPGRDDTIGRFIHAGTGEVQTVVFRIPPPKTSKHAKDKTKESPTPVSSRPDLTQKGITMIGDFRTEALQQALKENLIDDTIIIGLLVLALAGSNVSIRSPTNTGHYDRKRSIHPLIEGGVLTSDPEILRSAARQILRDTLSCKEGMTNSGIGARIAGDALGADEYLPNMATEEFLSCLSKPAIERVASEAAVAPRNTGKATRAALIDRVGKGTFLLPAARFKLSAEERQKLAEDVTSVSEPDPEDEESDFGIEAGDDTADDTENTETDVEESTTTAPEADDKSEVPETPAKGRKARNRRNRGVTQKAA